MLRVALCFRDFHGFIFYARFLSRFCTLSVTRNPSQRICLLTLVSVHNSVSVASLQSRTCHYLAVPFVSFCNYLFSPTFSFFCVFRIFHQTIAESLQVVSSFGRVHTLSFNFWVLLVEHVPYRARKILLWIKQNPLKQPSMNSKYPFQSKMKSLVIRLTSLSRLLILTDVWLQKWKLLFSHDCFRHTF